MAVSDNNGASNNLGAAQGGVQRVTIVQQPGTLKLSLDVDALNLDVALSLLQRAMRELESRYRFQRAQELVAEATLQKQYAAVATELGKRH